VTWAFDRRRTGFAALALSLTLLPSNASANANATSESYEESDARMAARVLAAQGSAAFEQRDFERALELFGRASAIIPAPTITLMEARSLVELGRLVEAADKYVTTQRMLSLDPANAVFRDAADTAERELELLLPRIPTLRVRLLRVTPTEQPEIQINGRKIPPALASLERPADPGSYRVEVRLATGVVTRDVTLTEGQHLDVDITPLEPPAPKPAPVVAAPQASAKPQPAPRSFNALGWTVTGAGAAFIGAGAVAGIIALNTKSELEDVCNPLCPREYSDDLDKWRLTRTLSYVGFGLGIAGVASGTYLLLRPAPSVGHTPRKTGVALAVGPASLSLRGNFQ
jgi:hypothetical protein